MGKWTPDYMDDVLHAKVKSLVAGSIKRALIEKSEPKISYEKFVEELDTGDSFTTSIIDLLVKELAERHSRPAEDKHAIAERTGRALENLSRYRRYNPISRYRRGVNNADFLSFPPPNHMDLEDDEDEFESMLDDPASSVEGSRNPDLYDTYVPRATESPSPGEENSASGSSTTPQPPARTPPPRSGPWSMSSSFAPLVTSARPPRRAPRTRVTDFTHFTSQRRLASRTEGSEGPSENRDAWNRHPQPVRRFFPFARPRRHETAPPSWVEIADAMAAQGEHDEPSGYEPVIPWYQYPLPSPPEVPRVPYETESEERPPAAPRLRRGGIRAPEYMRRSPLFAPNISPPPTLNSRSEPSEILPPITSREAYPTPGPGDSENSS
ncbi:hypothetical protein BDN72DRAFT_310983 [Pluteus cervinus]|uniref:Uncharacterized protein n=1 Tax=Pluteus cervinus TaxID=181527 RepID=A0ACD3ADA5_9AGAR|nr:hypothetical protein BDN72DRAFT_310983 [Pluteus cervinus]